MPPLPNKALVTGLTNKEVAEHLLGVPSPKPPKNKAAKAKEVVLNCIRFTSEWPA